MLRRPVLIFIIMAVTSGCSIYHVDSRDITNDYYASKPTARDVVFLETVTRPYEVIGNVTVNTERRQNINEVIQMMKRETAILGGDAITNIKSDATGAWKRLPAQQLIGNGYIRANFNADVVVFK